MSSELPPAVEGFPHNFVWGVATSAYQIEGSPEADGKGLSIWDAFSRMPGNIAGNHNGDVACDHYRRWREDVALMRQLGVRAYRFSIAWSRVLPEGTGRVNRRGLDFYDELVDELLSQNIQPYATLYHWDMPWALDARGGWLNRDCAGWFAEYAEAAGRRLADRVRHWITLNEPWVVADQGHLRGALAPGRRSKYDARAAANNQLRAHGAAVAALRTAGPMQLGVAVNLTPQHPASDSPADRNAARLAHAYVNRQFLDPILLGRHPDEMAELYGPAWRPLDDADLAAVRQPIDFVGVNYYLREVVQADAAATPFPFRTVKQAGRPHTAMGWEVYPAGLTEILQWVHREYGAVPLYITENGVALDDMEPGGDLAADPDRVAYLRDHLESALAAMRAGVDLRGYFLWSLLDNFEWQFGYGKRFGVVYVDFASGRRTLKASARWYRRQIEQG
ncbi:MAG: beta-glucosidase [Planctomycetota bacterium]|nr:MAG: beta-glucosidase [Planctomycetota bacterium]